MANEYYSYSDLLFIAKLKLPCSLYLNGHKKIFGTLLRRSEESWAISTILGTDILGTEINFDGYRVRDFECKSFKKIKKTKLYKMLQRHYG